MLYRMNFSVLPSKMRIVTIFRRVRVVAVKAYHLRHVRPSVSLRLSAQLPLDELKWNLIPEDYGKKTNAEKLQIWLKSGKMYRAPYTRTYVVRVIVADDIKSLKKRSIRVKLCTTVTRDQEV